MTITLYNSKSRTKEVFAPIDPLNVRMYVCGPTVYDRAHIGNARPAIVFDVLYRLLRHTYGDTHVTYVRNFTDVDDKINAKAAATGRSIREICDETIGWYLDDMAAVGVMQPSHMPRATEYIGQMVAMIAGLIAGGHAYAAQGHVLFRVRSYKDYGRLSGRTVDDMIAGARVEVSPFKEDPMDFVLWKPSGSGTPGWDSPWGYGRPGWHIECSAMAHDLLGESFDIHGGGLDLQFPHHENELAQSHCAHPHGQFARVWMHNEMLQVEGRKMSKSLGNFFTVRDLLDKGYAGEVIRFVMLSTHYRKPMDWTEAKAREAEDTLRKWRKMLNGTESGEVANVVIEAIADDLNTAGAIAALHEIARSDDRETLKASANFLGLLEIGMGGWATERLSIKDVLANPDRFPVEKARLDVIGKKSRYTNSLILQQIKRDENIINDFFRTIDEFRKEFSDEFGCVHENQVIDWNIFSLAHSNNVATMIGSRNAAKQARNFHEADAIRDSLLKLGFKIVDTPEGGKWYYDV